jgi:hypothetical protein
MKRILLWLFISSLLFWGCKQDILTFDTYDYRVPKVLFLTTSDGRGEGTVSDGAIVALQAFNRLGAFVRFENRTILWEPNNLTEYDIIIAPTVYGYHDADQLFSLTYMDDRELNIIKAWVKNGGLLVTGENFGRNDLSGRDRVTVSGELSTDNWVFGEVLGTPLKEINIQGFRLAAAESLADIYANPIILQMKNPSYILLPSDTLQNDFETWFVWQDMKTGNTYPAVFRHTFGKGQIIYFSVSRILHPALDGGLSGTLQIERLYEKVYRLAIGERQYPIELNPWPNAAEAVMAVTFNDGGTLEEYKYALTSLFPYCERITLFISGFTPKEIVDWCKSQPQIELASRSLTKRRFRELNYLESLKQIQMTEVIHGKKFQGFRFPFLDNSFYGMYILEERGYRYDSSISADHTRLYEGGIFPYNLPIFNGLGFVKSLDLLEISPVANDDWYYYGKGVNEQETYPEFQQEKDAEAFRNYLNNFWNEVIVPEKGVMTIIAHPIYSGKNQILLRPILHLVKNIHQSGKYWITSLSRIAQYWTQRKYLQIKVREEDNKVRIKINLKQGHKIPYLTLKLPRPRVKIQMPKISSTLIKRDEQAFLVFHAEDGQVLELVFD